MRVLCVYLRPDPCYGAFFFEQVEFSVKYSANNSRVRVYSRKRRFRSSDVNVEHSGYRN